MIVRGRPTWRDVFFAVRGSILRKILRSLLVMLAVSLCAVLLVQTHRMQFSGLAAIPFTLIGLSLSIFMSFRNTTCYERWWEGRRLWGQLITASRSFARQVGGFELSERKVMLSGVCAFAAGLAARLRNGDEQAAIVRFVGEGEWTRSPNPPDTALAFVGKRCRALVTAGQIDGMLQSVLEASLSEMAHVQGGCERLKNTPLPFSYSLLLHRTAYAFCMLLPFALAPSLDWWTPLPTLLVSYAFFGLDALSDELSDPFGTEPNDLPLDFMVRTIEREMLFAMDVVELPPVIEARDYVLL